MLGFLLAIAVLLLSLNLLSIIIGSVVHSYEYEGQGQKRTVTQRIFIGKYFEQYDGFTEKILTMKQFNADQQTNHQNI